MNSRTERTGRGWEDFEERHYFEDLDDPVHHLEDVEHPRVVHHVAAERGPDVVDLVDDLLEPELVGCSDGKKKAARRR